MNKDSCCRLLHIMHVVRHILPPHIARCQKNEIISFLTVICNFIPAAGYCIIISCMSLDTHPVPRCFVSKKTNIISFNVKCLVHFYFCYWLLHIMHVVRQILLSYIAGRSKIFGNFIADYDVFVFNSSQKRFEMY